MEKEADNGYPSLIEPTQKQALRIQVPYSLRFAIIWTVFFSIVGIVVQIIQSRNPTFSVSSILNFFGSEFITWLKSFGSFANTTEYNSGMQLFSALMSQWYYFLYTGGLLALLWGIISWIINIEVVLRKRRKSPPTPIILQEIVQQPSQQSQESAPLTKIQIQMHQQDINDWLEEGLFLLSEGRIREAASIYEQVKRYYDPVKDIDQRLYKRILDFYYEIMEKKK